MERNSILVRDLCKQFDGFLVKKTLFPLSKKILELYLMNAIFMTY